jgi:hypothetical protein
VSVALSLLCIVAFLTEGWCSRCISGLDGLIRTGVEGGIAEQDEDVGPSSSSRANKSSRDEEPSVSSSAGGGGCPQLRFAFPIEPSTLLHTPLSGNNSILCLAGPVASYFFCVRCEVLPYWSFIPSFPLARYIFYLIAFGSLNNTLIAGVVAV